MRVTYKDSVGYKVLQRLQRIKSNVIVRKDFADLGEYRQISRALKTLMTQKKIARIGHGIYAKCYESEYSTIPLIRGGFDDASREALNRLQIHWVFSEAEQAYNENRSTQVPTKNVVKLQSRCRRKIAYQFRNLDFEGNTNAR